MNLLSQGMVRAGVARVRKWLLGQKFTLCLRKKQTGCFFYILHRKTSIKIQYFVGREELKCEWWVGDNVALLSPLITVIKE